MDKLTLEEIAQAKSLSVVSKTMYVWHDANGVITGISNYPSDSGYLEVPKTRLRDFLSGKKDYSRYNIDYFKFDEALDIKDKIVGISNTLIYEIPRVDSLGLVDCTIIHNSELQHWELSLSDAAKALLTQINPNTVFEFHLTSVKDPHFLYKTIGLIASHMLEAKPLGFKSNIEKDIDAFTISTFGYFKSYGLLVV